MAPVIRVDDQVWQALKARAEPFTDTPNTVLRRLLGIEARSDGDERPVPDVWQVKVNPGRTAIRQNERDERLDLGAWLIPHSHAEFPDLDKLREFLVAELARDGVYAVAHVKSWRSHQPGAMCLFHKLQFIVGEALLAAGVEPYTGTEESPDTGLPYEGQVRFEPASVRLYEPPITFVQARQVLGRPLIYRGHQRLSYREYLALLKLTTPKPPLRTP